MAASIHHRLANNSPDFSKPLEKEMEGQAMEMRPLKADILFNVGMNLLMAGSVVILCVVPFFSFTNH
jgi:hypothetical protein